VDDFEMARMRSLQATFPEQTWRTLFEWLFTDPAVQSAIGRRIRENAPLVLAHAKPRLFAEEPDVVS
jgi:hypothetical protein